MYLKSKALLDSRRKRRRGGDINVNSLFFFFFSYAILCCPFLNVRWICTYSTEPHTKDIDVFLKRDIETGFGFRVLGGEGPQQPVSLQRSCRKIDRILKYNTVVLTSLSECISPGLHRGHRPQRSCGEGRSSEGRRWAYWHWRSDGEGSVAQAGAGSDDQRGQERSSHVDCTQESNLQRWDITKQADIEMKSVKCFFSFCVNPDYQIALLACHVYLL